MFLVFLKIGTFTFGGGMAMLPVIHKEIVDRRKWISEEEIIDVFAISQSMPGVIAINASIYVGYRVSGFAGAVSASLGTVLPAFLSILLVLTLLSSLAGNPVVDKVFAGIRAASAALILRAAINLGKKAVKSKLDIAIAAVSFIIIVFFSVSAMYAILMGALIGLVVYAYGRVRKHA